MKNPIIVLMCCCFTLITFSVAQALSFEQQCSMPEWLIRTLESPKFPKDLSQCSCLNPFYQRGDFDGDGVADFAVMVKNNATGAVGIAIVHKKDRTIYIVGAGRALSGGGTNFNWMDCWYVYDRGPVEKGADNKTPPKLKGDALIVERTEAASALIWWNGTAYKWYQQGD